MERCKICGKEYKNSKGINTHLRFKHKEITIAEYYEKYYPVYCIECNSLVSYKKCGHYKNYKFCSKKCMNEAFGRKKLSSSCFKYKYTKEYLIQFLQKLEKKYGVVTQRLVKMNGICHQVYYNYFNSFSIACEIAKVKHYHQNISLNEKKEDIGWIPIIQDSREQKPYPIKNVIVQKLDVGDYALSGYEDEEDKIVVERKSLGDLKSTLSKPDRFIRELQRAKEQNIYVVILIDCSEEQFWKSRPLGRVTNKGIYHQMKVLTGMFPEYCQFLFSGSRNKSMKLLYYIFGYELNYIKNIDLQTEYNTNNFPEVNRVSNSVGHT